MGLKYYRSVRFVHNKYFKFTVLSIFFDLKNIRKEAFIFWNLSFSKR